MPDTETPEVTPPPKRHGLRRLAVSVLVQVAIAGMVVVGATGALNSHVSPTTVPPREPVGACHPGNPLAGVHDQGRLQLVDGCAFVQGTVLCHDRDPAGDGDRHIVVQVDPQYRHELTATNNNATCGGQAGPNLVVEIIPQHCRVETVEENLSGDPTNCADAAGFIDPALPEPGTRVAVIGPLVLDQNHPVNGVGWTEIHPAQRIVVITPPARMTPNPQLCLPGGGDREDGDAPAATAPPSTTTTPPVPAPDLAAACAAAPSAGPPSGHGGHGIG
jgi:hypothetical protein